MKDSTVVPSSSTIQHQDVGSVLVELCLTDDVFFDTLNTSMAMIRLRSARPLHIPQNMNANIPPIYSNQIKSIVEHCQAEHKDLKNNDIKTEIANKLYKFQVIISRSISILVLFENKNEFNGELAEIVNERIRMLRSGMNSFTSTIVNRNCTVVESSGDEDRTIDTYNSLRKRMAIDINRMDAAGRILEHSSDHITASAKETENYGVAMKRAKMVLNFLNKILLAEKHMTRTAYLSFLTVCCFILLRRCYVEKVIRILLLPLQWFIQLTNPMIGYIWTTIPGISINDSSYITVADKAQHSYQQSYNLQGDSLKMCPLNMYRGVLLLAPFLMSGFSIESGSDLVCHTIMLK